MSHSKVLLFYTSISLGQLGVSPSSPSACCKCDQLRRIPTRCRETTVEFSSSRRSSNPKPFFSSSVSSSQSVILEQSTSVPRPITHLAKNLGFRPSHELGLLSVMFMTTVVFGAFTSLTVISLPTMLAKDIWKTKWDYKGSEDKKKAKWRREKPNH